MSEFGDIEQPFRLDLTGADEAIRSAAFAAVRNMVETKGELTRQDIAQGFQYDGERIPLVNPQRGIFKPRQMKYLLSISTVIKAPGRRVWYDDQREVHDQIFRGDDTIEYSFMGTDPDAADNRWLRDACDLRIPIIYFLGTSPGRYLPLIPTFVVGFDPLSLKARIAFATSSVAIGPPVSSVERRYALRMVKQRLHQASFREIVIEAYGGRCAISGLPQPLLLDAAHIVNDADEQFGQPMVANGLPLSKIHHAAFDAHLIGIDADSTIHVSEKLLNLHDGPTLEALRQFDHKKLIVPKREQDKPDRDRLAMRFEKYKAAA